MANDNNKLRHSEPAIAIQRPAQAMGVSLQTHGASLVGRCPFHDDPARSLIISPRDNRWQCAGECQASGSVIEWVMRAEGVSSRHTAELLRDDYAPTMVC